MSLVNDDGLERIMQNAGMDEAAKQKLRDANKQPATKARGHGPAGPDKTKVSDL